MIFSKRKWGFWLKLFSGEKWKIKLLWFKPGGAISLQKHFKRNELWLFLFGTGYMRSYFSPEQNKWHRKSTGDFHYVPSHNWHQFCANRRTLVLEIQTGLCREEDIERAV